jgi:hypothetical protein
VEKIVDKFEEANGQGFCSFFPGLQIFFSQKVLENSVKFQWVDFAAFLLFTGKE